MDILWFILIGIAAGWLAGQIMKGSGFGLVGDLIVGVIGALLGGLVFGMLRIEIGGLLGSLITATLGAVLLLFLLHSFGVAAERLSERKRTGRRKLRRKCPFS